MLFEAKELGLLNFSIQTKPDPNLSPPYSQRAFPIDQLKVAVDLFEKLQQSTKMEDKQKVFLDSEIELSTTEKSFALGMLKRDWGVEDGKVYLSLKEKLEK